MTRGIPFYLVKRARKLSIAVIFAYLCFAFPLGAVDFFDLKGISLGIGTLSPPLKLYQTDISGNLNSFQFNFIAKIDSYHQLSQNLTISLGAGMELPKSDEIGNKKFPFYFTSRLHYDTPFLNLFLGNMLYFQNQFGSGESVTLNNGGGMSEFYLPDTTHSSRNWIIEIGTTFNFTKEVFLEPTILLVNLTNKKKRNIGYLITLNYFFNPSLWSGP